jgi:hypothetical protein
VTPPAATGTGPNFAQRGHGERLNHCGRTARAAGADRVAPKTRLALSIVEAKRLLRHPVLLAGAALATVGSIQPLLGGEPASGGTWWRLGAGLATATVGL